MSLTSHLKAHPSVQMVIMGLSPLPNVDILLPVIEEHYNLPMVLSGLVHQLISQNASLRISGRHSIKEFHPMTICVLNTQRLIRYLSIFRLEASCSPSTSPGSNRSVISIRKRLNMNFLRPILIS